MRLGGWQRIWVVLAAIYTLLVAMIAYSRKPTLTHIHQQWFSDAAGIVSRTISDKEDRYIGSYDVQDKVLNKGTAGNIAWLERVEKSPKPIQRIFSKEIAELNAKYRSRISDFPRDRFIYWLQALAWWLGGGALLYLVGWVIGWVVRGFRAAAA